MVFGTFDILHPGHLWFFAAAKKKGEELIVVVARDHHSLQIKEKPTRYNERDRLKMVQALKIVNRAILGDMKDRRAPIKKWRPEVICLGYDQKMPVKKLKVWLQEIKVESKVARLKPYQPKKYKSTLLGARDELWELAPNN